MLLPHGALPSVQAPVAPLTGGVHGLGVGRLISRGQATHVPRSVVFRTCWTSDPGGASASDNKFAFDDARSTLSKTCIINPQLGPDRRRRDVVVADDESKVVRGLMPHVHREVNLVPLIRWREIKVEVMPAC